MTALPDTKHPDQAPIAAPAVKKSRLSPLNQRRWRNFRRNRRAFWSLWIFSVIFTISLFAEFLANDKPILVSYRGELRMPIFNFYPETSYGGDFKTEAIYRDAEVQCLIRSGGLQDCFDDPAGILAQAETGVVTGQDIDQGWIIWAPIRYSFDSHSNRPGTAPGPPDGKFHLLGTDDSKRDVLAREIYGFRLSILFTIIVTVTTSILGIIAGAVQGFFRRLDRPDLSAGAGNLGVHAIALRDHHSDRDFRAVVLAFGLRRDHIRLAVAGRRGTGGIPARAKF